MGREKGRGDWKGVLLQIFLKKLSYRGLLTFLLLYVLYKTLGYVRSALVNYIHACIFI